MRRKRRKSRQISYPVLSVIIILLIGFGYYFYVNGYFDSLLNNNDHSSYAYVDGDLKVSFIDVGQADSILIENDGKYALIDAGNNNDGDLLVNYFKELGINRFEYVFGTHAHEDHIGGMDNIINNFEIGSFYMPDALTTTKTFEDVLDALEAKNLAFNVLDIGERLNLEDAYFDCLYTGTSTDDLNSSSIVLKLTYGENTFLFTGDATSEVEQQILNKDLKSDVLKVGHHGSKYSSSLDFLKKVSPTYAIISVGEGNSYGHPTQSTLSRLESLGITIYRTDLNGTIIANSDGKNIGFTFVNTNTDGG